MPLIGGGGGASQFLMFPHIVLTWGFELMEQASLLLKAPSLLLKEGPLKREGRNWIWEGKGVRGLRKLRAWERDHRLRECRYKATTSSSWFLIHTLKQKETSSLLSENFAYIIIINHTLQLSGDWFQTSTGEQSPLSPAACSARASRSWTTTFHRHVEGRLQPRLEGCYIFPGPWNVITIKVEKRGWWTVVAGFFKFT